VRATATSPLPEPVLDTAVPATGPSSGQILVIFAAGATALIMLCALVTDVSWYWANSLKVQRAADAAALAGAVYLPGNLSLAQSSALAASTQNGYSTGLSATANATNNRQLDVQLTATVNTFFMKLIGINNLTAVRQAKAQYVMPVPMGSPLNYYGIGCMQKATGTQPACVSSSTPGAASGVPDAVVTTTQLSTQGFFGATMTKGGVAGNGDAYGPTGDNFGGQTVNPTYNPAGVYYEVVIPDTDANGTVWIYDPMFCGTNLQYGTGDHWNGATSQTVSTYYNLWDTNDTPYDPDNFTLVANSGSLFTSQKQADLSKTGSTYNYWASGDSVPTGNGDCSASAYHNAWWSLATSLSPGRYYLQVTTTSVDTSNPGGRVVLDASVNASTDAQNDFALEVTVGTGPDTPQVYGSGTIVAYNNLNGSSNGGVQQFYLAQIGKSYAGKTIEVDLFDIGDVNLTSSSQTAVLTIQTPNGGTYNNVSSFNFTADALCASACSGTGVSQITTSTYSSGSTVRRYNDSWIAILIALPTNYGTSLANNGWWKISYTIPSGVQAHDTTTWKVSVRGNPVHLIVP
jgi:hypothetical protein